MLIGKTAFPMDMGVNIFMSPTPIRVQKGDIVGIHVDKQGRGTSGIGKLQNCLATDVLSPKALDNGWMDNFVLDVGSDLIIDHQCVSLSAICTDWTMADPEKIWCKAKVVGVEMKVVESSIS